MSRISLFPVCFDHVNITVNAPVPVNIKWSDPLASQIRDGRVALEIRSYRNRWNRGQTRTPSTKSGNSILSQATRRNKRSFTAQGRRHHRELTISVTTHQIAAFSHSPRATDRAASRPHLLQQIGGPTTSLAGPNCACYDGRSRGVDFRRWSATKQIARSDDGAVRPPHGCVH